MLFEFAFEHPEESEQDIFYLRLEEQQGQNSAENSRDGQKFSGRGWVRGRRTKLGRTQFRDLDHRDYKFAPVFMSSHTSHRV